MKKINVAELLKDCPKGMELDCTMFDNVTFVRVDNSRKQFPIEIAVNGLHSKYLTKEGCFHDTTLLPEAKCVIFPKGKTNWEGFVPPCRFKDGDVVATNSGDWIGITTGGEIGLFIPTYCVIKDDGEFEAYLAKKEKWQFHRLATEEEKQKLFDAIKANGYKWNAETKTLEKLPKFKVGDRIKHIVGREEIATVVGVKKLHYILDSKVGTSAFSISLQREWELVPNKFDITTLKPYDKVLVRNTNTEYWRISLFGCFSNEERYFMCMANSAFYQCIPYNEDTKHLVGTSDDCDDFYKTWK